LTAGFHAEYSGMKFALFFMAEYIKIIAISMIFATLYLGGYLLPFEDEIVRLVPQIAPAIPFVGPVALIAKVILGLFFFVWLRATLPRFRYDRLMAFGWKILFPFALVSVLLTAVIKILVGG
jgi:NADH-quinone oxidoreductase subunit H